MYFKPLNSVEKDPAPKLKQQNRLPAPQNTHIKQNLSKKIKKWEIVGVFFLFSPHS